MTKNPIEHPINIDMECLARKFEGFPMAEIPEDIQKVIDEHYFEML